MLLSDKLKEGEHFTGLDRTIADYFLEHPDEVENLSARELAKKLYTSASAITRFAQKVGCSGYVPFQKAFLNEQKYLHSHFRSIDASIPFEPNDSDYETAGKIGALYKETVDDTLSLLDYEVLEKAARILNNARIIYIVSAGTHGELAELFRSKMSRIAKTVVYSRHLDIVYNYAASEAKDTAFLLISYTGETRDVLRVAKKARAMHHPMVVLTSYGQNSLSEISDCTLYLCSRERIRSAIASFSSSLSIHFLLDALYACIFRKDYAHNLKRKVDISTEYQIYRHSDNPEINDDSAK